VSKRIRDEEGAVLLDQYSNPSNPIAHYDETAEEILYQCDGKLDAIVVSVGTGGAITGIARKIKERSPNTIVVGVDPHGSILAMPQTLNTIQASYKVEGIGYDFIPKVLDRNYIDQWVKISDIPSFKYARELIQKEGLLVGGSSGSTFEGAVEFCKRMGWGKDKRVVIVFSDSVRNYITKFLSKEWCIENKMISYDELKE
jgi:cystathionine beta-synthase